MRKRKQLILAIMLGITIAALALLAGSGRRNEQTRLVAMAGVDLPAGVQLSHEHLQLISLPADLAGDIHFSSLDQLVGLWTSSTLLQGEIIYSHRVTSQSGGLSYPDPGPGRRLLTLRMQPAQANGLWLAAGNKVDIYLVPRSPHSTYESQQLRGVRIVAVLGPSRTDLDQENINNHADSLICLDLSVEQADLIAAMLDQCTVRLAVINELNH